MTLLVTGHVGFIGLNLVRYFLQHTSHSVVNVDEPTSAGNLDSLADVQSDSRYTSVPDHPAHDLR